jgi:all-trans-retinol 13,14-reductase
MNQADILIIGSGISALTCAALLSKKGKSVIVLEKHQKPGGYMHCFSRFGERFDTGAHYVGAMDSGQPFHRLLSYLNVFQPDLFTPLDPNGFDVFHFPDFQIQLPKGYEEVIHYLGTQFPTEKRAIQTYFTQIRKIVTCFPTYNLGHDIPDDYSSDEMKTLIEALEKPLEARVQELTSHPGLQSVLYSYCALHGVSPRDVSLGFHAIVTDSLIRGPYGLTQGGEGLVKSFVKQIEKNGGKVLTKHQVTRLEVKNRQIVSATTQNGQQFTAEWVISAIHPKLTIDLLSESDSLSPAFRDRIKNLKESMGLFGIYAVCQDEHPFDPLRNYYFFESSDPSSFRQLLDSTNPINSVFLSAVNRLQKKANRFHPLNLNTAGPIEWFTEWQESRYGSRPQSYQAFKTTVAERAFRLVDQYYSGFHSLVTQYATSSPLTNMHFTSSAEGSAYGIYHSIQNTGARALGPRTKILNLLLTGQNCLFPGLLGSAISALRTSGHIVGIKPLLTELRNTL